jgi:hypothetical protein
MNREDIIRMARVAGCRDNGEEFRFVKFRYLERFAALVAAAEREAFKAELDKEDLECLDDEAFNIVFGLQEWLKTRGQK